MKQLGSLALACLIWVSSMALSSAEDDLKAWDCIQGAANRMRPDGYRLIPLGPQSESGARHIALKIKKSHVDVLQVPAAVLREMGNEGGPTDRHRALHRWGKEFHPNCALVFNGEQKEVNGAVFFTVLAIHKDLCSLDNYAIGDGEGKAFASERALFSAASTPYLLDSDPSKKFIAGIPSGERAKGDSNVTVMGVYRIKNKPEIVEVVPLPKDTGC